MPNRGVETESGFNLRVAVEKWSEERVLSEARRRTKELFTDNPKKVQLMLAHLMVESGWTDEEFIEALCKDTIRKGTH